MARLTDLGKKKVTLEELERFFQADSYSGLVMAVQQAISHGELQPMKSSRTNGKRPPLAQSYWIVQPKQAHTELQQELQYQLHPMLQNDYYLKHLDQYQIDRPYVLALNHFWNTKRALLEQEASLNERSFQIWQAEKFLKEGAGQRILKHLGLTLEQLHIYQTTEPLAYYAHHKQTPQNIVLIENKDTFYSMRRHLLAGHTTLLGMPVGTLIYGGGKKLLKTITEFDLCAEPYLTAADNQFYYFGDLDYEGIAIYEALRLVMADSRMLQLFLPAYQAMLRKAEPDRLPMTKDGQQPVPLEHFLADFTAEQQQLVQDLLQQRRYIPQEILTRTDF